MLKAKGTWKRLRHRQVYSIRRFLGLNQIEMAHLLDMSLRTYTRIERGLRPISRPEQYFLLSFYEESLNRLKGKYPEIEDNTLMSSLRRESLPS